MHRILLPIDLDHADVTDQLLQRAADLHAGSDIRFVVLYVMDEIPPTVAQLLPAGTLEAREKEAQETLAALAAKNGVGDRAEAMVRRGDAQHVIVDVAKELDAELVVMASHKPAAADYLLGSVAAAVVRHAPCSVMVIR